MKERSPIFYDAERVRWRRTRRAMEVSGALLTLLLVYFFINIAASVDLPAALLPDAKSSYRAVKVKLKPGKSVPQREGRHRRVANIGRIPPSYDPLRAAFYVGYDANSLATLKKHYKDLDLVVPEELHAVTPDGGLTIVDYERYQTVKASPEEAIAIIREDKLHQWMRSANVELPVMGMLNNYDGQNWRVQEMVHMLANASARANLVRDTVQYAIEAREGGIVVGFANYGYDWPEPNKQSHPTAKELSVQEALLHAYESEAHVELDPASFNPHYSYSDDSDRVHQVWFLDAITAYNQMRAAERLGVQGTALWRLGSSDSSLWKIWDATRPDDAIREKLKDVPPGPDLILEGNGDIWRFDDKPQRGV